MTTRNEVEACRSLLYFLAHGNAQGGTLTGGERASLVGDLAWRYAQLDTIAKASVMHSVSTFELLPRDLLEVFLPSAQSQGAPDLRDYRDVAIVTTMDVEARAALTVMGRSPDDSPDRPLGTLPLWFGELQNRHESGPHEPISVVLTMTTEKRNVPCAIAVGRLLSSFDVGLLVLVGVAAGVRDRVTLGDVVVVEEVYDYEHVRLEVHSWFAALWRLRKRETWPLGHAPRVERNRPAFYDSSLRLRQLVERWMTQSDAGNRYREHVRRLKGFSSSETDFTPQLHRGTSAAGEKLRADGSLQRMYRSFDNEIRTGDQEDSGFAQAAEFYGKEWLVFRGISDYGDPLKPRDDTWHSRASLAAACAAASFLESGWSVD